MKIGVSTASFNGKLHTEDALEWMSNNGVPCAEVFLTTYSEYTEEFANKLISIKGNVNVTSIHTLNTQFEPQMFSKDERQKNDALKLFRSALQVGKAIGAKCYVMHGPSQIKYTKYNTDYVHYGKVTDELERICNSYDMILTWENVHWAHYNHPDFIDYLQANADNKVHTTLDIKQAMQSGDDYVRYLDRMYGHLENVHICDYDSEGSLCLPTYGEVDFKSLFARLKQTGYDGSVIIEVYDRCFDEPERLLECRTKLQQLVDSL